MSPSLIVFVTLFAAALADEPFLGFSMPLLDGRIVGGNEARPNEFPHQVSLQWGMSSTSHFCGGTILNSQWVLTAGHCIQAVPSYGKFVVKAGKHDLRAVEGNEQTVTVSKSIVHEQYSGGVAPYDIALVKLSRPLALNRAVAAARLPSAGKNPSGNVILSGWGSISKTSKPSMPNKLQTATLPVVDLQTCKSALDKLTGSSPLHSTNVCTGPLTGGYSACSGDSGGPLIAKTGSGAEIVGVVSWGIVPCGTTGAPSVYTKVSAFIPWIQSKISG